MTTLQQTIGGAAPSFVTIQTDYADPIGSKSKLEAGLRASFQTLSNDNSTYTIDPSSHISTLEPFSVSNYTSTSEVYAAYLNWTSALGKNFSYQIGLRAGKAPGTTATITSDTLPALRAQLSAEPVPFDLPIPKIQHTIRNSSSALRGKSTGPASSSWIPYTNYSDTLNITKGNPEPGSGVHVQLRTAPT